MQPALYIAITATLRRNAMLRRGEAGITARHAPYDLVEVPHPMSSRFPRWAAVTAASALTFLSVPPPGAAVVARAAPACSIGSGFAELTGQLFIAQGADIVGDCTQNPYVDPTTTNVLQPTTGGLLYFRTCDQVPVFTDGSQTWLLPSFGLQSRQNSDPIFDWECIGTHGSTPPTTGANPVVLPPPPVQTPPPAPPQLPARPDPVACPDKI